MKIEYVGHMGSDLTVVNAARVSFHKHVNCMKEKDAKLIKYLADHNHWTPFSHPQITVRVTAPIFVARQLFKHKIGLVENEVSRRYVDEPPTFFKPDKWRGRPTNGMKQGSDEDITITTLRDEDIFGKYEYDVDDYISEYLKMAERTYNILINSGVAPEQARMVLPQNTYTEWYWTGSLASFARVYNLRSDKNSQSETRMIVQDLDTIIRPLFPLSWGALVK